MRPRRTASTWGKLGEDGLRGEAGLEPVDGEKCVRRRLRDRQELPIPKFTIPKNLWSCLRSAGAGKDLIASKCLVRGGDTGGGDGVTQKIDG